MTPPPPTKGTWQLANFVVLFVTISVGDTVIVLDETGAGEDTTLLQQLGAGGRRPGEPGAVVEVAGRPASGAQPSVDWRATGWQSLPTRVPSAPGAGRWSTAFVGDTVIDSSPTVAVPSTIRL